MAKRESLILPQFLFSIVFMCNSGPLPHGTITVFLGPKSPMRLTLSQGYPGSSFCFHYPKAEQPLLCLVFACLIGF